MRVSWYKPIAQDPLPHISSLPPRTPSPYPLLRTSIPSGGNAMPRPSASGNTSGSPKPSRRGSDSGPPWVKMAASNPTAEATRIMRSGLYELRVRSARNSSLSLCIDTDDFRKYVRA